MSPSAIFKSDTAMPVTAAVIVAAGLSLRMGGGRSKQFLSVSGIPILARTLLAFECTAAIKDIVVVAKETDIADAEELAKDYGISKLRAVLPGGATRAASARIGFEAVREYADYVAIHDGARCLVTPAMIEKTCSEAILHGAASAAMSVVDTVKVADANGFISQTIDRNHVFLAATPQVFSVPLYQEALETAGDRMDLTDDNQLAEAIHHPVKLVDCGKENIKITYPADIPYAEFILKEREARI